MFDDMSIVDILVQIALILAAAIIATILRFWDFEHEELKNVTVKAFAFALLGAGLAAFLGWWFMGCADVTIFMEWIKVAAYAVAGMVAVRAFFEVAKGKLELFAK